MDGSVCRGNANDFLFLLPVSFAERRETFLATFATSFKGQEEGRPFNRFDETQAQHREPRINSVNSFPRINSRRTTRFIQLPSVHNTHSRTNNQPWRINLVWSKIVYIADRSRFYAFYGFHSQFSLFFFFFSSEGKRNKKKKKRKKKYANEQVLKNCSPYHDPQFNLRLVSLHRR